MKILRLDLRAFGPFTDVMLDLSSGNEGLHVIYGPNEAGKSSALRALEQMLFGIPSRSADDFNHSYQNLRIGATLRIEGRPPVSFLRRKGTKNTLLGPDNATPLDEAQLKPFLSSLDRELFATMFGIGHEQLVHGGREIVNGSGNVGQVLFAAGAGIADLQAIQSQLESQAAELFLPRGQTRRINQLLKALDEARRRIRQSQLPSDEWGQHDQALREARERCRQIESEASALQSERNRLDRLHRALPVIAKRKEVRRQLAELGSVVLLSPDFAEKRRDVMTRLAVARKAEQNARDELDRHERELTTLQIPEAILACADEIERLPDALGSHRKAQRDLPGLLARREQVLREAAAILHQIRPDLSMEQSDRLQVTNLQQLAIQRLGNRHEAVVQKLEQTTEEIRQNERNLAEAARCMEQLPAPRDASPLKGAVRRAQSQGDLEEQLREASTKLESLQRKAALDLRKFRLWSGTLDELEKLVVPASETVDRFAVQLAQSEQQVQRHRENLETANRRRADVERQINELELQGEVPSEEELKEARRVRDAGWQLVLQAWQHASTDAGPIAEFMNRFADAHDLADAYSRSVEAADEIADRLRREASRVAQRAALVAEQNAVERQADKLGQDLNLAEEEHRRIGQAWRDWWKPAGIQPLSPNEMQGWLNHHRNLLQQAEMVRNQQALVDQIARRIETHRGELDQGLASLIDEGENKGNGAPTLASLLQRSQAAIDRSEAVNDRRGQLQRDVQRLEAALSAARNKADRDQSELAEWQNQWAIAIEPLGLPPETTPDVANHVLNQILKFFGQQESALELGRRADQIQRDAEEFSRMTQGIAERACPDLASRPAELAAEQMALRFRKAVADRQKRDEIQQKARRYQADHEKARRAAEELTARLATMCREAGCSDPEELPDAERASENALRLRERLQGADDQLASFSAGAELEAFVALAESESPDRLPGRIAELDEEIHRLETARDEFQRTIGSEATLLASMDGNADAAEAAEEVQDLLARLETDAAQYVRLQLAKTILQEGIERYRKKAEGPVLRRASELFQRLTRGSFGGLTVDFNEQGQSILKGVRPDKGKTVELAGMSEGTADQLYLALRLASLESYLDGKEPVPFIVDDVLISFDDDRATTALEILADFSRRTQVIFFTHHAHLVRLAKRQLADDVLLVHQLPGRAEK